MPRNLEFEIYGAKMPNPKRRHSHSRTRQRRAHDALKTPQFYLDKDSGEAKVPHRIDPKTGMYKGRQIIEVKETE
jgi:large subunit ribosomal protein L32